MDGTRTILCKTINLEIIKLKNDTKGRIKLRNDESKYIVGKKEKTLTENKQQRCSR